MKTNYIIYIIIRFRIKYKKTRKILDSIVPDIPTDVLYPCCVRLIAFDIIITF